MGQLGANLGAKRCPHEPKRGQPGGPEGLRERFLASEIEKLCFTANPRFPWENRNFRVRVFCGEPSGALLANMSEQMALRGPSWRQDVRKVAQMRSTCVQMGF